LGTSGDQERLFNEAKVIEQLLRTTLPHQRLLEEIRIREQLLKQPNIRNYLNDLSAIENSFKHIMKTINPTYHQIKNVRKEIETSRWNYAAALPIKGIQLKLELESKGSTVEDAEMWYVRPVGFLLPKHRREEWLGDLEEARRELLQRGYPRWVANLMTLGRVIILTWGFVKAQYGDMISSKQ
jgi:hypothetical protein